MKNEGEMGKKLSQRRVLGMKNEGEMGKKLSQRRSIVTKKMEKPCKKAQVRRRTVAGGKGRFYVHTCQDTGGVFICERGVDNNIAEVFARNDNETVGDNAIFIADALNSGW